MVNRLRAMAKKLERVGKCSRRDSVLANKHFLT